MVKAPNKVCIERMYLNIIKAIHDKPIANIISNSEKWKTFPLGLRICSRLPLLFSRVLEVLASKSKRKKYKASKGRTKSPLADVLKLNIENPEDSIKKTLSTNKWIQ